jgi:hypothetical protein
MSNYLTGTLDIQKNYLNDLGVLSSNNIPVSNNLKSMQNRIKNLNNNYKSLNDSNNSLQTSQNDMINIVNTEKKRLDEKAALIDGALESKQRAIYLNDSARKRQYNYIYIFFALIIGILIITPFLFLQNILPIIPDSFINFIIIIVASGVIIYSIIVFRESSKRDVLYYDKLNIPNNKNLTPGEIAQRQDSAKKAGNLIDQTLNPYVCVGSSCCSYNSTWDNSANKCIIGCASNTKVDKEGKCINKSTCKNGYKVCGKACVKQDRDCYESFITLANNEKQEVLPYSPIETYGRV